MATSYGAVEVDAVFVQVLLERFSNGVEGRRVLVVGDGGKDRTAHTGVGEMGGGAIEVGAQVERHDDGADLDVDEPRVGEDMSMVSVSDWANMPGAGPPGSGRVP